MTQTGKTYDLEERTTKFSESILDVAKRTQKSLVVNPLIDQLIRSGTSVGANYFEANGASSKRDFRNKIYICKKEARETQYWLRLLAHASDVNKDDCRVLWKEVGELIMIFGKILENTK